MDAEDCVKNCRQKLMARSHEHYILAYVGCALLLGMLGFLTGVAVGDRLKDPAAGIMLGIVFGSFAAVASILAQCAPILVDIGLLIVFPSKRHHAIITWTGALCAAALARYQFDFSLTGASATIPINAIVLALVCELCHCIRLLVIRLFGYCQSLRAARVSVPRAVDEDTCN